MKRSYLIYLVLMLMTISSHGQLIEVYSSQEKKEVFLPIEGLIKSREGGAEYSSFVWKNYVSQEYVRNMNEQERSYITLEPKMAEEVFRDIKMSSNDSIFYYNYCYNEGYSIPVSKLRPVGMLNEYDIAEGRDLSYDVGLAFDQSLLTNIYSHYGYAYIAVGKVNPFKVKGDVEVVEWAEITNEKLVLSLSVMEDYANESSYCGSQHWKIQKAFKSHYIQYDLYSYELIGERGCYGYLITITERGTDKVVHTRFFQDSESKYLNQINPDWTDMTRYTDAYDRIRIGTFMKDKPPIYWGVQSYSFGCPEVFTLEGEVIKVSCVNNH